MKRALLALLVVLIALGAGAAFYVQSQRAHQSRAFARLEQRDLNGARGDLIALRGRTVWFPVITQEEAARRLFARGAYDEYLAFAQSFRERTHSANALLYTVAALALTGRSSAADKLLAAVDRTKVDPKRYASVEAALRARRDGHVPYVFDRTGAAIGTFDLTARTLTADDRAFQPILEAFISPKLGTDLTVDTTIDSRTQRAAITALGAYRGTLVAIDPRTNELLAIASANGATLTFPYHCTGALDIDGIRFGDWVPSGHGSLETIDEALAVSCNIVFADLGLRLGNDKLRAFMTKAGFDGQTDTGLGTIALGRIVPPLASRNDTAHFAIGLEHETVTPLHLAMLASMTANRGVLTSPRLLRARRTILGDVAGSPPEQGSSRIASERAATTMIQAMQAVVTDPRGTGRRAAVDAVTIAMKTGTAGSREKGYDALVMAFAPAESPKIAFAVIAENAGHAEVAGAQIAHDFVAQMFNAAAAVPAGARSESTGTPSVPAPAPAPPH
jgi:hypothetical protein